MHVMESGIRYIITVKEMQSFSRFSVNETIPLGEVVEMPEKNAELDEGAGRVCLSDKLISTCNLQLRPTVNKQCCR